MYPALHPSCSPWQNCSNIAGSFYLLLISDDLCRQLRIQKTRTTTSYRVQSVTGKGLNRGYVKFQIKPVTLRVGWLHGEQFTPLVLEGSTTTIILGRPWLIQHQPVFRGLMETFCDGALPATQPIFPNVHNQYLNIQ